MTGKRTRFAAARRAAGHTQESLAHALRLERSTVARWEGGESDPIPGTRPRIAQELKISLAELNVLLDEHVAVAEHAGEPGVGMTSLPAVRADNQKVVATIAASQSLLFATQAAEAGVSGGLLEDLLSEIGRLAIEYVHTPLWSMFEDLVATRDVIFGLLDRRQRPNDARELYFLAGTTCLLLAHASHNIGNRQAAFIQLQSAATCAEMAQRGSLHAWCRSTEALINEGLGRPRVAIDSAVEGQQFKACGESRAMLAGIEARAAARIGNHERALAAIERFRAERDRPGPPDDVCQLGGVLSFPAAKQEYYLGSVYGLLGKHGEAERHAEAALVAYENGPAEARSYGDEALARLDVTNARLSVGDLDGGLAAVSPVLALPEDMQIRQFGTAFRRTRALAAAFSAESRLARELVDAIDDRYGHWSARP